MGKVCPSLEPESKGPLSLRLVVMMGSYCGGHLHDLVKPLYI
jgi:hypothetical protein